MAFGKDDKNLVNMPTFRQQARAQNAAKPARGGGGQPYFINAFKPSTEEPDKIRILRGNYEVELAQPDKTLVKTTLFYFPYVEHFHGTRRQGAICSAGPLGMFKGLGEPCLGHEIFWADKNAGKKNGPMSMRDLWAFTIVHFANYAHVEQVDKDGKIKLDNDNKPYMNWERVFPHQRNDARFLNKEMRDYNVMHWSLGSGHSNSLMDYDKEIGRSCKSCGTSGSIICEAWACRSCGEALIEPATTTFSPKQIDEITKDKVKCAACGEIGMLQEFISCSACSNAVRAEIFDVDMDVKRSASQDPNSNQTTLMVTAWSNPRPIDVRYADIAKNLDLAKTFKPTPYEKQQDLWGAVGARQPVPGQQLSRPYGQGGGGPPVVGGTPGNKY